MAPAASSSSSWTYDVFLSFRGEDTRQGFTSDLYNALKQSGIHAFMDDSGIERGQNIPRSLLQAIQRSRMSIIIFSQNYASSRWCLDELLQIMECQTSQAQMIIPIFYKVDPSDVRHQRGSYDNAMKLHEKRMRRGSDRVLQWREALTAAANIAGFNSTILTDRQLVENIVEDVLQKLDVGQLFVVDHPVGIEKRVHELTIKLSKKRSQKSVIIGLWGMGGIGKTTIAKAIYNKVGHQFGARSFLGNIRENSKHANDQVNLQRQLIFDITKTQVFKIPDIDRGKKIIQERFPNIKSFVVLDDVDSVNQMNALCGSLEWFCRGSVIVITTRDMHLLDVLKAHHTYKMREMNKIESLELLSWHAFKQAVPLNKKFKELSRKVVAYCGGLPLALEILGSCLHERTIQEWSAALSKLQRIPNKDIHAKLKISYDGLNDHMEKDIFLDICCFFINKDRSYVTQILDGCGLHAKNGLQVLIERSLLKVGRNNKLEMHDLLQEMGKEIIRDCPPKDPEERSRLWLHEEVLDVLIEQTGTKTIEGISLKDPGIHRECLIDSKAFKEMRKLRLLQLDYVNLKGDYALLSKRLRWLCWHGFPLKCTPNTFYQEKLVAIEFKYSNLKVVWKEPQLLETLKTLNLSHSSFLIQTPNFTKLPNLERLVMKDCRGLILIDESIGDLKNLLHMNLKDCKSLRELPRSIYRLKSLKTLILSGCSLIDHLEEDFEQMEGLTSLVADNTAITQVPFSLARLRGLVQHGYVSLCGYEGRAQDVFPSLVSSWMSRSNIPQSPTEEFVQSISSLVFSVGQNSGFHGISPFQFARPVGSFNSLLLQLGVYDKADFLKDRISQGWNYGGWDDSHLPGDQYPDWFIYKGEGCMVNLRVPQVIRCQLKAMLLNVAYYSCMDNTTKPQFLINVVIINYTKATITQHAGDWVTFHEDEKWQSIIPTIQPGDLVELVLSIGPQFLVKKIAAYLIYDGSKRRKLLK